MDIPTLISHLSPSNDTFLIAALKDLDKMIGMHALKRAVVDQILFFLSNIKVKGVGNATDGHMLHTLLYGPPGVGKTVVGAILARLWSSLGILKGRDNTPTINTEEIIGKFIRDNITLLLRQKNSSECMERATTAAEATRLKIREMRSKIFTLRTRGKKRSVTQDEVGLKAEVELMEGEVQKLARLSSDALNYCGMVLSSLEEQLPLPMPAIGSTPPMIITSASCCSTTPEAAPSSSPLFKVVSRVNMVAEFLGQTAVKTKKLLDDHKGGVLLVDEAYSLYQGERDSFGAEALTVLNQYMSENADSTVLIFAGYKSALQSSVFKSQPGLARRFAFTFEITGYTPEELTLIFLQQVEESGWNWKGGREELEAFFTRHKSSFLSYGGDTKRLLFQCKLVASSYNWNNPVPNADITLALVEEAFLRYKINQPLSGERIELLEAQRTYEEESTLLKVQEFKERSNHSSLYAAAREQDRKDLKRRLEKCDDEMKAEERFKEDPPSSMYG